MAYKTTTFFLDRPIQKERVYDIFMPENVQHDTAIFIIHGGGWTGGSRTNFYTPIMETLAEKGYIVATTDYRLNVSAMEQLKDCRDAYTHFVEELKKLGRPLKIATYGSSAGAHLASLLSVAEPGACGDEFSPKSNWITPECTILQSCPMSFEPWDEIFPQIWNAMQHAARVPYEGNQETYKKLSLDHHIHPEMPRTFFIEAEYEHMFWPNQKISLAKKIASLKGSATVKIYQNMEHGFLYNFDRPHQREAFADMLKFIEKEPVSETVFNA
jgi:acetyl esterase/lipase